jgi:hypothetical protein
MEWFPSRADWIALEIVKEAAIGARRSDAPYQMPKCELLLLHSTCFNVCLISKLGGGSSLVISVATEAELSLWRARKRGWLNFRPRL